jgi:hypothetical protein
MDSALAEAVEGAVEGMFEGVVGLWAGTGPV